MRVGQQLYCLQTKGREGEERSAARQARSDLRPPSNYAFPLDYQEGFVGKRVVSFLNATGPADYDFFYFFFQLFASAPAVDGGTLA